MTIEIWKFVVCIIVAIVIGGLIGWHSGKTKSAKPVSAGIIDFEPGEDGGRRCVFKLEGDIDWLQKQKFIIFEVRSQ